MWSSWEEHRVAFIRCKKVHGHAYHQVVRNYRDGDGKHRQEVLDHLGVHDTIEATLTYRRMKVASHREQAKALSRRVDSLRVDLRELYSDDLGGEIPSLEEAWGAYESSWAELYGPDVPYHGRGMLYSELLEINLERADQTIDYYALISQGEQEKALARRWQEKIDHLLHIQTTYF